MKRITILFCFAVAVTLVATMGAADDRQLVYKAFGADPNVLIIVDSSGSMSRDVDTDSQSFVGGGEDPHTKLFQVKVALTDFLDSNPNFNMGYSSFARSSIQLKHHLFLYHVKAGETAPDFEYEFGLRPDRTVHRDYGNQTFTFGEKVLMRFGQERDGDNAYSGGNYHYRPRFGTIGQDSYADWGTRSTSQIEFNGTTYTGHYRSDMWLVEPNDGTGWYYPAIDWNTQVEDAIDAFQAIHNTQASIVFSHTAEAADKLAAWTLLTAARDTLQLVLDNNQIGSRELTVRQQLRQCTTAAGSPSNWDPDIYNDGRCVTEDDDGDYQGPGVWVELDTIDFVVETAEGLTPSFINATDTTVGEYPARMMATEYSSYASSFDASSYCQGIYAQKWGSGSSRMVIPMIPTPRDEDPDMIPLIKSYMRPQPQMQFFFPTRSSGLKFWPKRWDDESGANDMDEFGVWATDRTLWSDGSTPLGESLWNAYYYYKNEVKEREDPLKDCRQNFVILLSDGLETCNNSPCNDASNLASIGVQVFVIGYGMGTSGNNLQCIADNSNGLLYLPNNIDELVTALTNIGKEIEERSRGFAAPIVPSVETATEQAAFIAEFMPRQARSIWRGRVRSYPIDPNTGMPPLTDAGQPDKAMAFWDAGHELIYTDPDDRKMFYGINHADYTADGAVPGTRFNLKYTTNSAERTQLRDLIRSSLTNTELNNTVEFIRGDRPSNYVVAPDTQTDKLGDIFHSTPGLFGPPACFSCDNSNLPCALGDVACTNGYRDDQSTPSDILDGFRGKHKYRRRVLLVGANDGTMHGFNAGLFDFSTKKWGPGDGTELFAWAPTEVMDSFDELAVNEDHTWTVDGSPAVADVYVDPIHNGTPNASQREWRTMVMFGERRGGKSLTCLDLTKPDTYDGDGVPNQSCMDGSATGCDGPWPRLQWEFTDADLAQTWSRPVIIFAEVTDGTKDANDNYITEMRSVAVFGGGWDPFGVDGDYAYMVDIETGKVLWKAPTENNDPSGNPLPDRGMVPAEIAAVDINFDGFPERLYYGDTNGYIYRVDLEAIGILETGEETIDLNQSWKPEPFAYIGADRPIHMRPSVAIGSYAADGHPYLAVSVGSGDREDVFNKTATRQLFVTILDFEDYATEGTIDFRTDSSIVTIAAEADACTPGTSYLNYDLATDTGYRGWELVLAEFEKVNTHSLVVLEYITFSTFTPSAETEIWIDPETGKKHCSRKGNARTYVMNLFNANPLAGSTSRYIQHDGQAVMATDPVVYLGSDGSLHVAHLLDDKRFEQVMPSVGPPLRITSWREDSSTGLE
ncbi:MAG: VWA domain-containing protein [bacterium]|nr:VWA domain-containing protein [bacterium]